MGFHYILNPPCSYGWGQKKINETYAKGNNSSITDNHTIVMYIQYNFHETPSSGYLVMAEDGKTDGWKEGQRQTNIPLPLVGDIRQIPLILKPPFWTWTCPYQMV